MVVVVAVVTQLLSKDGGMAEDTCIPEAGKLSRVWIRGHRETKNRQKARGARSPQKDGAEWYERHSASDVSRRCKKDFRCCHF